MKTIIILSLLAIGIILLQIFLSKRESKWPGLIIPILTAIIGFLLPLFNYIAPEESTAWSLIFNFVLFFLVGNIPNVVFLGIYFGCREKLRRNEQLKKMNIQDLN